MELIRRAISRRISLKGNVNCIVQVFVLQAHLSIQVNKRIIVILHAPQPLIVLFDDVERYELRQVTLYQVNQCHEHSKKHDRSQKVNCRPWEFTFHCRFSHVNGAAIYLKVATISESFTNLITCFVAAQRAIKLVETVQNDTCFISFY